jgi:hypothetical protein
MRVRFRRSQGCVVAPLAVLGAIVLTGCGPAAPPSPAASVRPPQEVVKQRAESRWGRLIARDFSAAYTFEAPAYRSTVTLDQYRSQFGDAVSWNQATVESVDIAPPGDRAEVAISLHYQTPAPLGGEVINGIQPLVEHWILAQGDWWLVRDPE